MGAAHQFAVESVAAVAAAKEVKRKAEYENKEEESGNAPRRLALEKRVMPIFRVVIGRGVVNVSRVGEGCIEYTPVLKVGGITAWDVAAEPNRKFLGFWWYLTGGIENHLSERPAHFNVTNFVHSLEGTCEAFRFGVVKDFFCAIVVSLLDFLKTNTWDSNSVVKDVYKPARPKTHIQRSLFVNLRAPTMLIDAESDFAPIHTAKFVDALLISIEIISFIVVAPFEYFMRRVPVFAYTNKMIHIKVDGRNVNTIKQAWGVNADRLFIQQWKGLIQALIKPTGSNQIGTFPINKFGTRQKYVSFQVSAETCW